MRNPFRFTQLLTKYEIKDKVFSHGYECRLYNKASYNKCQLQVLPLLFNIYKNTAVYFYNKYNFDINFGHTKLFHNKSHRKFHNITHKKGFTINLTKDFTITDFHIKFTIGNSSKLTLL